MAYLYKSRTTGKTKTYRSKKWYGAWQLPDGTWKCKALSESRSVAQRMLHAYANDAELASVNLAPRERLTLAQLAARFRAMLDATTTADYARMTHGRLTKLLEEIHATNPDQLTPAAVQVAAAALTSSLRTRNHYVAAAKQFARWLLNEGHARRNLIATLKPAKHDADPRYVRRAMTREEWDRLAAAAATSRKRFRGLTGPDRLTLYVAALTTGIRAGGLAKLKVGDFAPSGLARLAAKFSKNRREQLKFLPDSAVLMLAEHFKGRGPEEHAWPGTWAQDAAEMLRIDLKAAGISHATGEGVLDFHSFRNTSITWMLEAGTAVYLVQRHADHASPSQTMKYARPARSSVDEAVERVFAGLSQARVYSTRQPVPGKARKGRKKKGGQAK